VGFGITEFNNSGHVMVCEVSEGPGTTAYKILVRRKGSEGGRHFDVLQRRSGNRFFGAADWLPEGLVTFILQLLAAEPAPCGEGPFREGGGSSDYAALVQMIEEESESSGVALGSYRTFEGDWYEPSQVGWSEEAYRGVAVSEGYFFTAEEVQFRLRLGMRFTQAEITQAVLEVLSRRFGASLGVR
jgi:hypothetical protein